MAADDTPADETGEAEETRATRLRLPLRTLDHVKAELGRLYREGRTGRRDVSDVSKLANVLSILGRLIEGVELAARVEALENQGKAKA